MELSKGKIAELYYEILNRYVVSNGHVLMEKVVIPTDNSSPDLVNFEGKKIYFYDGGIPFSFIGKGSDVIITKVDSNHPYIFACVDQAIRELSDYKSILKYLGVIIHGDMTPDDLKYYIDVQKTYPDETRINTRSGRIWKNISCKATDGNMDIVTFWCREADVRPDDLKYLKKYFKLGDMFWAATDTANFNFYGDDFREVGGKEIKELKSKIFPELTHEQIVDILMRSHSNFRMSNSEKKVVWEFRGINPEELKYITGGYPTTAEYNYNSRMSESTSN